MAGMRNGHASRERMVYNMAGTLVVGKKYAPTFLAWKEAIHQHNLRGLSMITWWFWSLFANADVYAVSWDMTLPSNQRLVVASSSQEAGGRLAGSDGRTND